ncbi:hypothetical protein [Candidatus Tisiphia endosymbiont of Nedyus quadrimaculatus]|uniref:hypothetical protein n=1 Tax=Candidatus Tisiphia endosymbiont of Nedyus quadrimaculatus TaxID=3139332 RepID=UPI00345F0565
MTPLTALSSERIIIIASQKHGLTIVEIIQSEEPFTLDQLICQAMVCSDKPDTIDI